MTSTAVKGMNPLMNYVSAKQAQNAADNLAGSFSEAFGKAAGNSGAQDMQIQADRKQNAQIKVNHTDKKGLDESKSTVKMEKPQTAETDGKAEAAIQKEGEELAGKVAEELGITVEQVVKAMEALGLTMADLLNTDNMTQLVLTIEGADMLSLMTDEGLYNSLQNLLGMVKESVNVLQDEFGMTAEELTAVLEQVKAGNEIPDENLNPKESTVEKQSAANEAQGQEDYTVTVERDGEVTKVSVKVDGNSESESTEVTSQKLQTPEQEADSKSGAGKKNDSSGREAASGEGAAHGSALLENLLNRDNAVKAEPVFENALTNQTADTKDIMNQIMDYMKIQVKADLTQMEIQLHPASLGTVNINISSKEGVITAQFFAQNETVKAAIESQIVQLKSSFEEQGLKVEAVEVTIASHEFERNLSGNGGGQEQTQDSKKKNVRKINLNDVNAAEEAELDEAQQIAVEMMTADGSTVDFTA